VRWTTQWLFTHEHDLRFNIKMQLSKVIKIDIFVTKVF